MKKETIKTSPKVESVQIVKMDFYDAIRQVISGKSVARMEWKERGYFLQIVDGRLKIHKPDGKFYDLIVTDGDILGEDWMLVY